VPQLLTGLSHMTVQYRSFWYQVIHP